jgi:FAD/FMN-containing dehydrogenase
MRALIEELAQAVGSSHVLTDPSTRAPFETDWTRRWSAPALAVVRPADCDQVAAVLRACSRHGIGVVPQGGNTGLVGGSTPRAGVDQVVLSLTRLTEVGPVDLAASSVSVGAGVTLARLQAIAHEAGLDAGLDLGARDSATIAGLAACDAGGLRAIRYGTARTRVAGLRAVLSDGRIIDRRAGLLKDNAGYDLPALLIGSEGTLAVITDVVWRLVPRLDARALALIPVDGFDAAVALVAGVRPVLPSLELCELMTDAGVALTADHLAMSRPVDPAPAYVLLECAATTDPLEELAEALHAAGVGDRAVVATDAASHARLLRLREAHTEAIAAAGVAHKIDVGVPLRGLAAFADQATAIVRDAAPEAQLILFGHLGDGNLHVNILGLHDEADRVEHEILALAIQAGGTISAEHGIGVQKAEHLPLLRGPDELRTMADIKAALDPPGILNPGVLLAR